MSSCSADVSETTINNARCQALQTRSTGNYGSLWHSHKEILPFGVIAARKCGRRAASFNAVRTQISLIIRPSRSLAHNSIDCVEMLSIGSVALGSGKQAQLKFRVIARDEWYRN